MIEKTFFDGRGREVLIQISDKHILFYHVDELKNNAAWVKEMELRGNEVSDEEKTIAEFYWIDKTNWVNDFTQRQGREDNWHNHMKDKNWFTGEMYKFMNAGCGL